MKAASRSWKGNFKPPTMLRLYFAFFWLLCYKESISETRSGYYRQLREDKQKFIIMSRSKKIDEFSCALSCAHAELSVPADCKGVIYNEKDGSCYVKFDERDLGTIVGEDILYKKEPQGWFYKKVSHPS